MPGVTPLPGATGCPVIRMVWAMKTLFGVALSVALVTVVFIKGAASPGVVLAEGENTPPLTTAALVSSVVPAPHSASAGAEDPIVLTVSERLDASSFDPKALAVWGRWSGVAKGRVTLERDGTRIRFEPGQPFHAGESITVTLR